MEYWMVFLMIPFITWVNCDDQTRDARWWLGDTRVTTTKLERLLVTETTHSSCIMVAPSLPRCRGMRQMKIAPSPPTKITPTAAPQMDEYPRILNGGHFRQPEESLVESRAAENAIGWREYLGFPVSTVTNTIVKNETTVIQDQQHVITFSITGCEPTQLPFNLDYCNPNGQ
ncbi:hypothetical protein C0J52_24013 [Blattella germanica]|nr:hypothetical protein C0J52_24013 [Blattella germanica]